MVVERLIPVINTSVVIFANITYRTLMQETLETHRAIVNSIEHKDPVGAKCAMNMHLTYNRQVIMEFLEKKKKDLMPADICLLSAQIPEHHSPYKLY